MSFISSMSDESVLAEMGVRLARLRLDRNLTQSQLATEAGVSRRTVERVEAGESAQLASLVRLFRVLGVLENLDAFLPEPTLSPVEQLKLGGKARRRASMPRKAKATKPAAKPWTWGDDR